MTGAIRKGCELTLNLYRETGGEGDFSAEICYFVLFQDGVEPTVYLMEKTDFGFSLSLRFNRTGLYFYYFDFGHVKLGCGQLHKSIETSGIQPWQLTVFEEEYATPDWMKGGVMYQIFPDRFYRASGDYALAPNKILRDDWGGQPNYRPNELGKVLNNDFFGGNLKGVIEKLDYLASLKVSVIYFNPIFEAYSNHRYDTGDYMKIDPLLGTTEDFDQLIAEAEKRGIKVILDGVFNHTGDNSRYFNKYGQYDALGAYQSPDSPYFDWYRFRAFPESYESWWGIETLPAVNEASLSYQNFILGNDGVLKTWLRHGIGGYRLDVADELPDFFLQKLRNAVKEENPEAVIIGEVWEDASNKISYDVRRQYFQGRELDSVMNYPLKDAIIHFVRVGTTALLRETMAMLLDNYPKASLDCLMNSLGTHDTPRILTVLGNKACRDKDEMAVTSLTDEEATRAKEKVRMAAVLQYTLPGVPCVFYGDEIGMQGYMDPFCRGCYTWDKADEALRAFYKKLGEIRTELFPDIFKDGEYREIFADTTCIVYERRKDDRCVIAYVNNSSCEYIINLQERAYIEHITGERHSKTLKIKPFSYGILSKS